MKILITGVGTTGKSTLRRLLTKRFRTLWCIVEQYDADEFKVTRCDDDADCKRPERFQDGVLYIIEDVRGTVPGKSFLPISAYDLVIYVRPGTFSHFLFWLPRLWRWFQNGYFAWDRDTGWKGTRRTYDIRNILPILREFLKEIKNRRTWMKEDRATLANVPHTIIRSIWTPSGIRWKV